MDWAPPSTAARHCRVERTTLFSGCWAVSVAPEQPEKKRSRPECGLAAPNRWVAISYHRARAARTLAASSNRSSWLEKWKDSRGANESNARPRAVKCSA